MKLLITGAGGQLGMELTKNLREKKTELGNIPEALENVKILAVDIGELDISDIATVRGYVGKEKPDVIINCAAFTNVDACETERDAAFMANSIGPRNLAIAAGETCAKLIHISTDYVFAGDAAVPYGEWDVKNPKSAYGLSKHLGEEYVRDFCPRYFIVRTSWLYGYYGKNFVKTILGAVRKNKRLRVVDDQRGNPTNAADLAHHILKLADTEEYGIYHCTGGGECSWYEFAREFIHISGIDCEISPCTSEEYASPVKRPAYSSLDNRMLRCTVGDEMRDWREAIAVYMESFDCMRGEIIA